jgi:hypothetical protein
MTAAISARREDEAMRILFAFVLLNAVALLAVPRSATAAATAPTDISAQQKPLTATERKARKDRWCKRSVRPFRSDKEFARREAAGCFKQ